MHYKLLEILACPRDKEMLEITVESENGEDIIEGTLTCSRCKSIYPINDSIPNLLIQ